MTSDTRFDILPHRRGSGSYKWDSSVHDDVIPLWVADMDFRVAEPIIDALAQRVDHGVFGYTHVPQQYYTAIESWYEARYGLKLPQSLSPIYTSGVVPAISATIKALTHPGDGVAVLTPVYNCFFSSIRNNGCRQVDIPLKRVDGSSNFTYEIDFESLEIALKDPRTPILLFCNPHNPACRAWRRDELQRVYDICRATGTILVSDEIHGDLIMPGYRFTPVMALDNDAPNHTITFSSPSKAFNIAGLQIANIFTGSERLRYLVERAINDNEVCDVNPFGVTALIAAYTKCSPWLDALNEYIHANYETLSTRVKNELPIARVAKLEATYLAWLDVSYLGHTGEWLEEYLVENYRVWVNCGEMYGTHQGTYLRINLATSSQLLNKGLDRLIAGLRSLRAGTSSK